MRAGVVAKGMTTSGTLLGTWRANEDRIRYSASQFAALPAHGPLLPLTCARERGRDSGNCFDGLFSDLSHGAAQSEKSGTSGEWCATFLAMAKDGVEAATKEYP